MRRRRSPRFFLVSYFPFTSMVPERCWVFSGGRMSGYGVMLCLCGFLLIVLGSQPFRIMLEIFFVLFLLCFVTHVLV